MASKIVWPGVDMQHFGSSFENMWNQDIEIGLPEESEQSNLCFYALGFQKWFEELCNTLFIEGSIANIQRAKVHLVDEYAGLVASMPKRHKNNNGSFSHHECLYDVFMASYKRLRMAELSFVPNSAYFPSPPPPTPAEKPPKKQKRKKKKEQIKLFIGERVDE